MTSLTDLSLNVVFQSYVSSALWVHLIKLGIIKCTALLLLNIDERLDILSFQAESWIFRLMYNPVNLIQVKSVNLGNEFFQKFLSTTLWLGNILSRGEARD